ncbi:hypothetical protein OCK02_20605 [Rhizobium sp. TRM96647]|jgi:hypothetical protein|nr:MULTISPECIES: hypothetical protein [unclassified Rhizobium]MCV3738612.1 hypothetical protein [Rhizobium sp. TRM96647]MCV3760299.1 hypothetical protein [Rhizobium sp. TRM96650]
MVGKKTHDQQQRVIKGKENTKGGWRGLSGERRPQILERSPPRESEG